VVGSVLKTHYTGWLLSGRKFGSSKDLGKPLQVVMGAGKMIKGWEVGLEGMREGGVRWFRVGPAMGYGATAYSMIPSNSTLVFRVELVSSEIDEAIVENMDFFPDTTALTFENGPEGLRYAVIKQGEGKKAVKGDTISVTYKGSTIDGNVFDEQTNPVDFPLDNMIPGWIEGLQLMNVGSEYELYIPAALGYGENAVGQFIKPNSVLIFNVKLVDIKKPDQKAASKKKK